MSWCFFFFFFIFFIFFFQAEDGIRDHCVTGVQTCALPISHAMRYHFLKKSLIHGVNEVV